MTDEALLEWAVVRSKPLDSSPEFDGTNAVLDGWYADQSMADGVAELWRTEYPGWNIAVIKLVRMLPASEP
jgi:hypothetical protein